MEIKINPKEESSKALRELAHFLLRLSDERLSDDGEWVGHSKNQWRDERIRAERARAKDIFRDKTDIDSADLDSAYSKEQNGQIPTGMFSLFDTPTRSTNSGDGFGEGFSSLINDDMNNKRDSADLAFTGKNNTQYDENQGEEKSEMIYDISEFFY